MKKVLSALAISALVLTANAALAGGRAASADEGCSEACQQQIDDLLSSQAQQDEQLNAYGSQLENHEGRISALEMQNAWYARLGIRAAWMDQKIGGYEDWDADTGFGGAIAVGRQFGNFRAEMEFAYQGGDLKEKGWWYDGGSLQANDGDYSLMTIMVNGYYEIPVTAGFSFYGMAGLGYAKYDVDGGDVTAYDAAGNYLGDAGHSGIDASDNAFAYKLGAGVTYNFSEQWAADLGYEYLGVADTDIADSINGHNVVLSVRFKF